jgi:hypothetical protein
VSPSKIVVEIVYALATRQVSSSILLPEGSTVGEAIRASGLAGRFPDLDPTNVGIYGKKVQTTTALRDRDRVEIYRPLRADPKEARRIRAAKKQVKG